MNIDIFDNPECFVDLEAEWLQLLSRTKINHIFYTPQFQKTWWKHFGTGKLCVLTFRDNNQLCGVASLYLEGDDLCIIGNRELTDYADLIIDREKEREVHEKFVEMLKDGHFNWGKCSFLSVPQHSSTLTKLLQLMKVQAWKIEQVQQNVCPVITLPKTWEEYLQMVGKKQRHELRRKLKNIEEEVNPELEVVEDAANLEQALDDFIRLHKLSSEEKAAFWTPAKKAFFKDFAKIAAENNWLKLFFLRIENERIATAFCFDYNNQFFLYNSGYDPNRFGHLSVGVVLTSYTIQKAVELGRDRYDFLRGDEEYKFRFGAVAEPIYDVTARKMG